MNPNNFEQTQHDLHPPDSPQAQTPTDGAADSGEGKGVAIPYVSNPFQVLADNLSLLFQKNFLTLLGFIGSFIGVALIVPAIVVVIVQFTDGNVWPLIVLAGIAIFVGLFIFLAAFSKYSIETVRQHDISFKQAITVGLHKAPGYFVVNIMYFVLVSIGLLLFIVPGVLFALWFLFASFAYVDQDISPLEAFKRSKSLVSGKLVEIGGMYSTLGLVSVLGAIPVVGLLLEFILAPLGSLSWAYRYTSAKMLEDESIPKPPTHVANKIMLGLLLAFLSIILGLIIILPIMFILGG